MKNCPYCNAEILDEAVFCVHCQSPLTSNVAEETSSDINKCPHCGNECDKNAILCVKCGGLLEKKANKNKNNTSSGKEKIIYIINIVLCALGAVGSIIILFDYRSLYNFVTAIGAAVVFVGLIIGKKNIIPAIGYFISTVATVITVINNIRYNLDETLIFILVPLMASVVQSILVALLYLGNKTLKKSWYIPAVLCFVISVIYVIINIIDNRYTYEFYYTYFDWEIFLVDIATRFGSVIGVAVTCLNAKVNWYSEEKQD